MQQIYDLFSLIISLIMLYIPITYHDSSRFITFSKRLLLFPQKRCIMMLSYIGGIIMWSRYNDWEAENEERLERLARMDAERKREEAIEAKKRELEKAKQIEKAKSDESEMS